MRRSASGLSAAIGLWLSLAAFAAPPAPAPTIGSIDFFGLRNVSEATIRKHLPFKEGDPVPDEQHRPDLASIARAAGVAQITLAPVCCNPGQKFLVYVGVAEHPVRQPRKPSVFTGTARLPDDMIRTSDEAGALIREAIDRDQAGEDDSQGHALAQYPPLRAVQQKLIDYARDHVALALAVLATSADARHRAVAADILGYAPDKRTVVAALARSMDDPDGGVRNNAARALGIISEYSVQHPELGIRIDPKPFVEMLNSRVWTDLNKGLFVLAPLTAGRDPELMKFVDTHARAALIDMCRWQNPGHSFHACMVLRRIEGMTDWSEGDAKAEVLRRVAPARN